MLLKILAFVVVISVIFLCFNSLLLSFKVDKEQHERFEELLKKEKEYNDLQSQIRKISTEKCDSSDKDL